LQDYVFAPSSEDKSIWTRKCYGVESLVSTMADNMTGFPTPNATVSIEPAYDRVTLEPAVKAAWITLRHFLPAIAVKSSRLPAPDNHYTFSYHVPQDLKEVQTW
ncbi:hypothetical protein L218DRAFT_829617, partial [Marasmius fiardii PR-910]